MSCSGKGDTGKGSLGLAGCAPQCSESNTQQPSQECCVLDRESSSSGSGSGSVPAADRCWDCRLPARLQQPAAPGSRTAAGPLPLPRSPRPGADVRHRPPPARSTNSRLPARRAPDGFPDAPAQCGKAIPATAGSAGMMNPLSCPCPVIPAWMWSCSRAQQAI